MSSSAQQPCPKKQSKAGGSKQLRRALAPTHHTHLSDFAVQQLSQAGVSAQLLQQLQTVPRTDLQTYSQTDSQSALHVPRQGLPDVRRPGQKAKPKRQAEAKGDSMRSGSSTGTAQRAQSLKARQEAILGRLSTLEVNQAHSSLTHAGSIASGSGLAWQHVKPTMQVSWTGLLFEAALSASEGVASTTSGSLLWGPHKHCLPNAMRVLLLMFSAKLLWSMKDSLVHACFTACIHFAVWRGHNPMLSRATK